MSRKKLVSILAGFLACMLLFTILSRAADSAGIANVQAEIPKNISLDHSVSGSGKVVQSREEAVSTLPDIKVDTIYVGVGSQVEANAALFDLNMEDIREQLLKKKQVTPRKKLYHRTRQPRIWDWQKSGEIRILTRRPRTWRRQSRSWRNTERARGKIQGRMIL